jgi:TatD DNase family protein
MFIDTHCHLQLKEFQEDLPMVIGNAKKVGVKKIIVPGVDALSSQLSIELSQTYKDTLFCSVGFHPYEASHNPNTNFLKTLVKSGLVVAIGEIGLDYHLYKGEEAKGKKQEQIMLFEEQLRLANFYNLPVIMHCRDAYEDFFTVLDSLPKEPRGVIHCFSGGLQELRQAQERKLLVGIDGNVTYSKQLASITTEIPLSMLLLETDAPYLTPLPHRGTRNEPKYIPLIAKKIAELQQKTIEEIQDATTKNAQGLFDIMV